MLIELHVIISQYMCQVTMLYTLNLYSAVGQLYHSKTAGECGTVKLHWQKPWFTILLPENFFDISRLSLQKV